MQKFEISKRLQNFQRKKASYTPFCKKNPIQKQLTAQLRNNRL